MVCPGGPVTGFCSTDHGRAFTLKEPGMALRRWKRGFIWAEGGKPAIPWSGWNHHTPISGLQQALGLFFDDRIAFAGARFEAVAVDHRKVAAGIADKSRFLQDSGRHGDARPAHGKHLRHELLRQLELV